jgi:predicted NBD/HSP70 family sugar kinase
LRLAEQDDAKAIDALERMAKYLGAGIAMLITGLAPDVIVIVGEVTRAWERIGPVVQQELKDRSPALSHARIVSTDPDSQPRLRGTITLVLQKHFGAPLVA